MTTPFIQWLLRGGFGRLVLFRTDTGESVSTTVVRPVPWTGPEKTQTETASGLSRTVQRRWAITFDLAGWPDIGQLRQWEAAEARVQARIVSAGRGAHVLWDEPVTIDMGGFNDPRPSLSGDRLTLSTRKFYAAITESPNLLERSEWTGDAASVVFPAPGVPVYAFTPGDADNVSFGGDITIEARSFAGAVVASATNAVPTLTLPGGTWSVRVTGAAVDGVRPVLTTYPASSAVGAGGYGVTNPDTAISDGFASLVPYGQGTLTPGTATVTLNGVTFDVDTVAFGDAETRAARVTEDESGALYVRTTPSLDS